FDVNAIDPFSDHADPPLGRADAAGVSDVEMPAHPLAVDRAQVFHRLLRLHDEIVPDVLDGDLHTRLLRHWNRLPDLDDGAVETFLIGDAVTGHARHQQHAPGAVRLRIVQARHQAVQTNLARRFVRR